jgi:hypothetical protein
MAHLWREASSFVKVLLVLQTAIIVGLSVWMYNEYLSNSYLRTYLDSLLRGTGPVIPVMGLGGLVAIVLVGILLKAGSVLGDIQHLSETVQDPTHIAQARPETSITMPVLEILELEPVDEISRLHGSLRRWNERSK